MEVKEVMEVMEVKEVKEVMEVKEEITTKSFTDLRMWQKSHDFVLEIYKTTENFPKNELFGLTSQLRRAAVSIAANIAEGYKRKSKVEKLRFFNISQGSLEECRYYLILSKDLMYFNKEKYNDLVNKLTEASMSLNSYCKKMCEKISS